MTISVPDLIEYSMKAWLLLFLCKDSIELREKYRSVGKILFSYRHFWPDTCCHIRIGSTG